MPMSIKSLRRHAQVNLCPDCYQRYIATIEPSIKSMVLDTLFDWRATESYITQMVMKDKGVFKSEKIFLSIDEEAIDKFEDEIDVKAFKKISKWSFKNKIVYLHKEGILPDSCYMFLDYAREVRRTLHDDPHISGFTEQDLASFSYAHVIADKIHSAMIHDWGEEITHRIRSDIEKGAERLLQELGLT